ncbi:unnamed protein product [Orchesella dallaii]|uniref:Uncharacterized protein n=1 Tax=Orchesella dallaii TaxID=48710 RepID=A0ABP1QTG5_9HEXA
MTFTVDTMPKSKYVPLSGNLHLHAGIPAQFQIVHPDYAYQRRCVKTMVYEMQARGGGGRHDQNKQNSSPSSGSTNTRRGTLSKIWDNLKHPFRYFKRITSEQAATEAATCSVKTTSPMSISGATYRSIRKGKMAEVEQIEKVQSWIIDIPEPVIEP